MSKALDKLSNDSHHDTDNLYKDFPNDMSQSLFAKYSVDYTFHKKLTKRNIMGGGNSKGRTVIYELSLLSQKENNNVIVKLL